MIEFRLGQTEEDAPVMVKAHRQGAHIILHEGLFSELQAAALNSAAAGWLGAVDVWQLWNGEIVDLRGAGPEPRLRAPQPVR